MSEASRDAVREAAQALVDRLNVIHNDPLYRSVWECAHIYGIDYSSGPTYVQELMALRAALETGESR